MANQLINNMEKISKIGQFFKKDFEDLNEHLRRLQEMVGGRSETAEEILPIDDDVLYDEDAEENEGFENPPGIAAAPFVVSRNYRPDFISGYLLNRDFFSTGLYLGVGSGTYAPFTGQGYPIQYSTGDSVTSHIPPREYIANFTGAERVFATPKRKVKYLPKAKKHHPLTSIFADKKND